MPDPQKIGKYSIVERIGRGGMGYVYRAHDPILKRDVAIKTMLKDVSDDPELRSRFTREAQSAGGLRHPNIVTIYDLGEDDQGCPFIAMEFLTGTDLEHVVKNKIEMSLLQKLDIIIQTCNGLGYAHLNGIVHRDIKAANIRLLDNGEAKIMDFGIAKMTSSHFTRTGMVMGTPHYMAPEQIRGEKVDGRADIFSLGVVLFELMTYRKPFPGDNPTTVLFKIIHENPDPMVDETFVPPEGLDEVVTKALAKNPADRYSTCEEFAEDLRYVFQNAQQFTDQSGSAMPTTPSHSNRMTATPLPTPRPGEGTPVPNRGRLTLPSRQRLAATQLASGTGPQAPTRMPAQPTQLSSQTNATYALPATEGTAQQPVETVLQPRPVASEFPPISPTPVPSASKRWIILASSGALGVVMVVVLAIALLNKPSPKVEPTKPPIEKKEPPPVIETKVGWLALNIQPWAEISELKDEKGRFINPPASLTPCRLELEPGKYEITLSNKQFKTLVLEVEIKRDATTFINRTMQGFDHRDAIESLGL